MSDIIKKEDERALITFVNLLNKQQESKNIKVNEQVDGSPKYIPINVIEKSLDECFGHNWSTNNLQYQMMLNSVVCSLDLAVILPSGVVIHRAGIGAVPIQLKKDQKEITPFTIHTFALQKNLPSAKSFALSNAAQSLGEYFGRNLNRKEQDMDYTPMAEILTDYDPTQQECFDLLETSNIPQQEREKYRKQIKDAGYIKLKNILSYLKNNQHG